MITRNPRQIDSPDWLDARIGAGVVVLVYAIVVFWGLGDFSLFYYDEIKAMERARGFEVNHDLLAVYLNGEPNFNKPPLQYYLARMLTELTGGISHIRCPVDTIPYRSHHSRIGLKNAA